MLTAEMFAICLLLEYDFLTVQGNGYLGTMETLIITPNLPSLKIHFTLFLSVSFSYLVAWLFMAFSIFFSQHFTKPPPSEVKRPSSLSSCPLKTDETIALVTEKVRKMDAR